MNKKLFILLILALLISIFATSCVGDKQVVSLEIVDGLKTEYELGETPDFSSLVIVATYNDESREEVRADRLTIGTLDTSTVGTRNLDISYRGITLTVSIKVKGAAYAPPDDSENWDYYVTGVSLPDSLALLETNKKDFLKKDAGYVVGDDNPFFFRLKLSVFSADGNKLNVTNYAGLSKVYLDGAHTPLEGEELARYLVIDEDKNSFDFTEEAIGHTFKLSTSPRDGVHEENRPYYTKSITVSVVDGYNVYEAYELNYITNTSLSKEFLDNPEKYPNGQLGVVDAFLKNEKNATRPQNIASIVLHNNLDVKPSDLPSEYFVNGDRGGEFIDNSSFFAHELTAENPTFAMHGNYFAIYVDDLPRVANKNSGTLSDLIAESFLFHFCTSNVFDMYFDHTTRTFDVSNLMISGNDPNNDNLEDADRALHSPICMQIHHATLNVINSRIQEQSTGIYSKGDYTTLNVVDSIFQNAYQTHFYILSENAVQVDDNAEPLPKELYPRNTLNITSSIVKDSNGPAIISQTYAPDVNKHKHSGTYVKVSEDTVIENWVTGQEAWFKALGLDAFIATPIKLLNNTLMKQNSSIIKEEIRVVNGTQQTFKLFNAIYINVILPGEVNDFAGVENALMGNVDIDGKFIYGDKVLVDMDDYVIDGKEYSFGNTVISDLKSQNPSAQIIANQAGGVAYTTPGLGLKPAVGDIAAQGQNDRLILYYYSVCLVFSDYHTLK